MDFFLTFISHNSHFITLEGKNVRIVRVTITFLIVFTVTDNESAEAPA